MRIRDIVPIWRLERFWHQRGNRRTRFIDTARPTVYEDVLRDIATLPKDWHGAGACGPLALRATALYGQERRIVHSAETGVGKSTLLLSHMSQHHTVFAVEDTGTSNSLNKARTSPLLKRESVDFVVGPTQATLPRHTFEDRLQLVLLDGPHGYPFPELEYYFFYPHLDENGLLIIDDIHIPTIFRLFSFLREEAMFDFLGVALTTAFFRRNSTPTFHPQGDGWWLQKYNKMRYPVRAFDRDFTGARSRPSKEFHRVTRT
ncbi:MAG: methyltransferase [Proteobacteria bacterium]|nr:MAG: methyltransferase [Pseudomonadota bacterium]